jgi:hypothetical protein
MGFEAHEPRLMCERKATALAMWQKRRQFGDTPCDPLTGGVRAYMFSQHASHRFQHALNSDQARRQSVQACNGSRRDMPHSPHR